MNLKGIILAGGLGSRLHPLTEVTNKHLLPVYDKPMVFYPIETLVEAGIRDIMLVTGGQHAGDFLRLLGNGEQFGLKELHYTYQRGEGGIAAALRLTERFAAGGRVVVILGDNLIEGSLRRPAAAFMRQTDGAKILLKRVPDPERFGVPVFGKDRRVVKIEEKPRRPKSPYAVTGIYMYDSSVYDIIRTLKPSRRGELEITDVNNAYLRRGRMTHDILKGWWTDAGTFDSLLRANALVAAKRRRAISAGVRVRAGV